VQIDYRLTAEDHGALAEHLLRTSDVVRAQRARQRVTVAVLVFAAVVVVIGGLGHDWLGGLFTGVVVAIGMWLVLPRITGRATSRRLNELAEGDGLGPTGPARLVADGQGLHETVAGIAISVPWARVARIDETDGHVFVFIGPNAALIVPKTTPDVAPMLAEIRSGVGAGS
jgi:hypothetical protein